MLLRLDKVPAGRTGPNEAKAHTNTAMDDEGSVVLVTGGGGGIGGAICRRFSTDTVTIAVAGRNEERCGRVVEKIRATGKRAGFLPVDVADPESIEKLVDRVQEFCEEHGPLSGIVNNAGVAISSPILAPIDEQDRDLYELHMNVNFHGPRRLIGALLADMKIRGFGRIINIASSAGLRGYSYVTAYCASKHALVGYTRAAALELAATGVTINAICRHYVDSPLTDNSVRRVMKKTNKSEKEARDFFAAQNPSGKLVSVDDVADTALRLYQSVENGCIVELDGAGSVVHIEEPIRP